MSHSVERPQVLPGGTHVLFSIRTTPSHNDARIGVLSLETGDWETVWQGGIYPRYSPTGHLLYIRSERLMAVQFDVDSAEVVGEPVAVLPSVHVNWGGGASYFTFSNDGTLVYLPVVEELSDELVWVDRLGEVESVIQAKSSEAIRKFWTPRISPNGSRVSVTVTEGSGYEMPRTWIHEFARGISMPLTFEEDSAYALWETTGERLVFTTSMQATNSLKWKAADGGEQAEQLRDSETPQVPTSISRDGVLLFQELDLETGWDIWMLELEGDQDPERLLASRFNEGGAVFSLDGQWIAFASDQSGQYEVYVTAFPAVGSFQQVSAAGGREPVWGRSGNELFYQNGGQMMTVPILAEDKFESGAPKLLFESGDYRVLFRLLETAHYDVSPDGRRFVMVKTVQPKAPNQVKVILNWFAELERLVPLN